VSNDHNSEQIDDHNLLTCWIIAIVGYKVVVYDVTVVSTRGLQLKEQRIW
jgi:hypothetical protein